jgi:hypothetical protein
MRPIFKAYGDSSTRRRLRQKLRMLDRQRAAIREINLKRLKRPGLMHAIELLGGHEKTLTARYGESNILRFRVDMILAGSA